MSQKLLSSSGRKRCYYQIIHTLYYNYFPLAAYLFIIALEKSTIVGDTTVKGVKLLSSLLVSELLASAQNMTSTEERSHSNISRPGRQLFRRNGLSDVLKDLIVWNSNLPTVYDCHLSTTNHDSLFHETVRK